MPFLNLDVGYYQYFAQDLQFEFILWQFYGASQWGCGLAEFRRRTAPPAKPVSKFTLLHTNLTGSSQALHNTIEFACWVNSTSNLEKIAIVKP